MLATRHDVRLGLHRLRLEGGLAEIREPDLRFTVAEAAELFAAAGVDLPVIFPMPVGSDWGYQRTIAELGCLR